MPIAIGEILGFADSAFDGINALSTSGEERAKARIAMFSVYAELVGKTMTHEMAMAKYRAEIITAEAKSKSWIARNWRPSLMFVFAWILFWSYGVMPLLRIWWPELPILELPTGAWTLLTTAVGGYIVSRGVENSKMITAGFAPISESLFDKRRKKRKENDDG